MVSEPPATKVGFMADHWKSLANMLGAPGIDSPTKPTPAPESESKADTQEDKPAEDAAADVGDEEEIAADVASPEEDSVVEVAAESASDDGGSHENQSSADLEAIVYDVVEIVEDSKEDDAEDGSEDDQVTASESADSESPLDADEQTGEPTLSFKSLSKPAPKKADAEPKQEEGKIISALGAKAKSKPAADTPEKAKRAKPKRKTSWDTLAGMFGLGSTAADETEPASTQQVAPRYRVQRDFDEIDHSEYRDAAFTAIKNYFKLAIAEIDAVEGLRGRFVDRGANSFGSTVVNRGRQHGTAHITVHCRNAGFALGDIYFSFTENAADNTANGGFNVSSDEYEQFLIVTMSMFGNETDQLNPEQAAEYLWNQFIEQAGISHA